MGATPPLPSGFSFADEAGAEQTPPLPSGFSFADETPQPKVYEYGKTGVTGMRQSLPEGPVAGSGPLGLPAPPAAPARVLTPTLAYRAGLNNDINAQPGQPEYEKINRGIGAEQFAEANDEAEAAGEVSGLKGAETFGAGTIDANKGVAGVIASRGQDNAARAQMLRGLTEQLAGGGSVAFTLGAPEVGGILRNAMAGDLASKVALAKIAGGFAAGAGASAGAGAVADKYNLSPEAKDLLQTAAFFLPSLAGEVAGIKEGHGTTPAGDPAYVAGKGPVKAGVVQTPEAYDIRAGVGNASVGVRIPRGGAPAPPEPPSPGRAVAAETEAAATSAITQDAALTKAAENMVNGVPPQPAQPQGPPPPADMQQGQLTQKTLATVVEGIRAMPQNAQAIQEAHGQLAKWMLERGQFVGPDGTIEHVDTPAKAASLAAKFINDELKQQNKDAADQAKQQEKAQADQQKQAEKQQKESEKAATQKNENGLTPAEQQYARAKTIIESSDTPQQASARIMRSLKVTRDQAQNLIAQHASEQQRNQVPDVGSKAEPTKEEARSTVDAQMAALSRGDIPAVMLPDGSKYIPQIPNGFKRMDVRGEVPGAGIYIYNPQKVRAATIREAAKAGTHGDLMGHVETKEELADGKPTVVVQATSPTGTVLQDSQVHPENVQAAAESLKERHPGANIGVATPEDVLAARAEATKGEGEHAVQESGAGAVLQREPEGTGVAGSERGRVEPGEQGHEAPGAGEEIGRPGVGEDRNAQEEVAQFGRGKEVAENRQSQAEGGSAEAAPNAERRTDLAQRKRVDEMTPEEMRRELLTSPKVDLPNRRAFDQAPHSGVVGMSDADGLKAFNDRFGYEAGDNLLRAKAEALKAAGLDAYHDKGDEFLYRGSDEADLKSKLDRARSILRDRIIEVTTKDGDTLRFRGADFSFGTGGSLESAEAGLKEHKQQREASGERARGELRGITEVGSGEGQVGQGTPAREAGTNDVAKPEAKPPAKGDRVQVVDRQGNTREGTVAHSNPLSTRVKTDTGELTVRTKDVKPAIASPAKQEDNTSHGEREPNPAGLSEAGGGRPPAEPRSEDRSGVAAVPAESLSQAEGGRDAHEGNPADRNLVHSDAESVPGEGSESGPGPGSDQGADSAPARVTEKQATAKLEKPKTLNRGWFSHPENWQAPTGVVGKLEANLKALRIVRDVEKYPRKLTDDERTALANYVGWGALQWAFDPWGAPRDQYAKWKSANEELQKLLSPDELSAARASTKNAHYTSPELVRYMWDTLQRFGFKAGNILEPAAGVGNFLGMMPKSLRSKSRAITNELDAVSHAIAKLLYPEAVHFNKDFADLILPDNDVDVAIGNPPFGDYQLYDPKYKNVKALVHDFFFMKSIDKVRPGGVLAFITSTGTMDKREATIRNLLASKANFLGAIRLPSGAFKANAGTDVTTDLIFLQKRALNEPAKHAAEWQKSTETSIPGKNGMEKLHLNEYFQAHPEMMLGKATASTKMYGSIGFVLEPHEGKNINDLLKEAQKALPRGIFREDSQQATGTSLTDTAAEFAPDNIKEGQFTVDDKGKLKQRVDGKLVSPEAVLDKAGKPQLAKVERFKALVGVRDTMNQLLSTMLTQPDTEAGNSAVATQREKLERAYNGFVKKYGYLNGVANNGFRDDPHYPRLLALEEWDKATRKGTPADIFRRRTIFPREQLRTLPEDPKEALQLILAERGFPDIAMMARLSGKPADAIVADLKKDGLIYRNPSSGDYETRETYLSGYVRDKLKDAQKAVKQGLTEYAPNVEALKKVVPADIEIGTDPATSVAVRLGATWIPTAAIQDFIADVFKSRGSKVTYTMGSWKVEGVGRTAEVMGEYGTPRLDAADLLQDSLNQKQSTVYDTFPDGSKAINKDATTAAQAGQQKIQEAFQKWAAESHWKPDLQELYNQAYNNLAQVEYDGSHLTFPGANPSIKLKTHQVNAVWRILQDGRALLAHEVGAGKTFEMAAAIMEGRRVGTFKKPMLTVPNHIVEQFRKEFLTLYPGANLLVPTEQDFDAKNRQRIMSRIATGDYDAIILPHSQFNLMDISPERQRMTMQREMDELEETILAMKKNRDDKRTVKQLENAKAKLEASMKKLADLKADKAIYFDDTGVDALFVDEAHLYKNLSFYTKMTRIAGLQQAKAKSALRLKMKTDFLQDRNRGRGVVFATGTPIQNTMAELYTMMKYVAPDVMEKAGIKFFDDWAANFGRVITAMELSADGRSYKARAKFAQFQNVPELMNMFRSFADIKTAEDLDLPRPTLETGKPMVVSVPPSDRLEDYVADLMRRAEAVKSGSVDPKTDNMLKITTDGRKAATDLRLIDPTLPDDADSKINTAVDKMFSEWQDGKDGPEGEPSTQMAFLDLYRAIEEDKETGETTELLNLYNDMRNKLVKLGVPREQIALVGEHDTRTKRQELFDKVNKGHVRILFGSTHKMGAGTNAQRLLKALHHIDLTWRPGDLAQRNGRILRQGNLNKNVRIFNYLTERSFDAYMAQTLQGKAEFISQIMSGKSNQRVISDVASEMVLSLEEMKIAASGNPDVKLQYDLQMEKAQLESLQRTFESQRRANAQNAQYEADRARGYENKVRTLEAALKTIRGIEGEGEEKGIQVELDGKTFTDRKELGTYLEAMDVPPGNFYMRWNGIGVSVNVADSGAKSGMSYLPEYAGTYYDVPVRKMDSLARSLEARMRQIPDDLDAAKVQLPKAKERAQKLAELAERKDFPEKAKLDEVKQKLAEVEKRLGMRDDAQNALAQAVQAEVTSDPEEDLLSENEGEDDGPEAGYISVGALPGVETLSKFWDEDVAPHLAEFGGRTRDAVVDIVHTLYPRFGANADAQDILGKARGQLEAHLFHLEHLDGGLEKFFDRMPREQQLAFIDRYKLGVGQPNQNLQRIESIMRAIDDASLKQAQRYKPTLTAKEDHFRVIWKVIPNGGGQPKGKSAFFSKTRRPWQGDKGFMKRATLETISEGINAGGVPITTNPWKLFTLAQASMMKFISAQRAWEDARSLGLRKFVKKGQTPPEGWEKINDRIADVYFPEQALNQPLDTLPSKKFNGRERIAKDDIETHTVLRESGGWYGEPGFARLLNNYLSRDMIRLNPVGSALMFAKNLSTAIELGVSPFHAVFETIEAMGSQFGLGWMRFWNNGVRMGEGSELTAGMKDMSTFLAAPYSLSREGGNVLRYAKSPSDFLQTPRGKAFLQRYPNATQAIQDLFNGGLTWGVQRDFRFDPQKSMAEAAREGNYVGAVLRAVPWVNTVLMKPLFEAYIPRLKWGFAMQQYAQQMIEHADALANGDTTPTEIARRVTDTVENRFGEMNFNNVYWNNTFKSMLQFEFRSVTWKLGNWRGAGSAVGPEAAEAFRDPLDAMRQDFKQRKRTHRFGEYLPKVGMNQGWLIGMAFTTAVLGTLIEKYYTGKWPWEMVEEDEDKEGKSLAGALALEITHPRTGKTNPYTGVPERITLPTGFRDFEHAVRDPRGYFKSSTSGVVSHAYDTTVNRDSFGNYVYDPNGDLYQKTAEIFSYNAPKPITVQNFIEGKQTGGDDFKMGLMGLTRASGDLDLTPAQKRLRDLKRASRSPMTPEQIEQFHQRDAALLDNPSSLTPKQLHSAMKTRGVPYIERMAKSGEISYFQLRDVYNNYATPAERRELKTIMDAKRQSLLKRDPVLYRREEVANR